MALISPVFRSLWPQLDRRGAASALVLGAVVLCLGGCPRAAQKSPPDLSSPSVDLGGGADEGALILSEHDGLGSAREALEAALRLPVDLPLPFPRVEHRGDRYRVTLARGGRAALLTLAQALKAAGAAARLVNADEAQSDEVVRLGIVCTEPGGSVPLFRGEGAQKAGRRGAGPMVEVGRAPHGRVLLLADAEEDLEAGGGVAERGYLRVLGQGEGLVRSTDVLLPPDCTPRDEDNDDGNGRILATGRLCLTTRFAGKDGELTRAALLAVHRSYRRCTRFADAGTFDGFDHDAAGAQFAVEVAGAAPEAAGVQVYDVSAAGELKQRLTLAGVARPAYLGGAGLAGVWTEARSQSLVLLGPENLSGAAPAKVEPRRLFTLPGAPFAPRSPSYRPAAPALHGARVAVTLQQACEPGEEQQVRARARKDFRQCVREVEVEVGLDGSAPRRRCLLNNAPVMLDEALTTSCP